MDDLTLAEWRQIELALVARIGRLEKSKRPGKLYPFMLETCREALEKAVAKAAQLT
jgi:hypothetical protein